MKTVAIFLNMDFFPNSQLGEPASVNASAFQKDFIALFQMQPNVTAPAEGVFASKGVFSCNRGSQGKSARHVKSVPVDTREKIAYSAIEVHYFRKVIWEAWGVHGLDHRRIFNNRLSPIYRLGLSSSTAPKLSTAPQRIIF